MGLSAVRPRHVYAASAAAFVLLVGIEGARMAAGHDPALASAPRQPAPAADGAAPPAGAAPYGRHRHLRDGDGDGRFGPPPGDDGGQLDQPDGPSGSSGGDQAGQAPPLETHQS